MFLLFFPFPPARNASQREAGGEERKKDNLKIKPRFLSGRGFFAPLLPSGGSSDKDTLMWEHYRFVNRFLMD